MRILSRHFLASYLTLFAVILVASIASVATLEMLINFDEIFGRETGWHGALTHLVLRVPSYYLRDLLPVASFGAAFFCLAIPARRHEFTAIRAGGISPIRAALPVLLAAGTLSLAAFITNETLVLEAFREWQRFESGDEVVEYRRGTFWYRRGNVIYNVGTANHETRILEHVMLLEIGPRGRLLRSTRAHEVYIDDDDRWHFRRATLRTFDPDDPARPPRVEFESEAILEVGSHRDTALLGANAATLSLPELSEFIELREQEGRTTAAFVAIFHSRLAAPLTVFIFALIAIPLGLAVERTQSFAASAVTGMAWVGLYYVGRGAIGVLTPQGPSITAPAPWLLLACFTGIGVWRLTRIAR